MSNFGNAVEYTRELVKINSFETEGKYKAIKYVENILRQNTDADITLYGMDTDAPFMVAKIIPENPQFKLLIEGHLDVVSAEGMENPFDPVINDGIMYGRGSCDMKSGCAAILTAFIAASHDKNIKGALYLMYSTDEEYAGEEIKTALKNGIIPKVDFAAIAEPTGGIIRNTHKGEAWVNVDFTGKSAHSSMPEKGINAIYMASAYIEKLRKLLTTYEKYRHVQFGVPTMSVGVIEGGSNPNVVAPNARIKIDIRYLPGEEAEKYVADLVGIADECKREWPEFKAEVKLTGNWNSLYTDKTTDEFKTYKTAIDKAAGYEIETGIMTGWGEGGYINMYGIPTAYYGPGSMDFAHTPNEHVAVDEITIAVRAYYNIIKAFCF